MKFSLILAMSIPEVMIIMPIYSLSYHPIPPLEFQIIIFDYFIHN